MSTTDKLYTALYRMEQQHITHFHTTITGLSEGLDTRYDSVANSLRYLERSNCIQRAARKRGCGLVYCIGLVVKSPRIANKAGLRRNEVRS